MSLVTDPVGASSEQDKVLSEDVLGYTRDGVEGTRQTESFNNTRTINNIL